MNLAESLRIESIPMIRLAVNGDDGADMIDSDIRLTAFESLGRGVLLSNIDSMNTGILSTASSITPLTTELSDETIDRIANRVYELIRQRGLE